MSWIGWDPYRNIGEALEATVVVQFLNSVWKDITMQRVFGGLMVLGLALGLTGVAQADYTFTRLDAGMGAVDTFGVGINDAGQIVGFYVDADKRNHGFLLVDGVYTSLDVPGATETGTSGLNAYGQIVGCYSDGGLSHGFLLSDGVYNTIDVPGAIETRLSGINASPVRRGWHLHHAQRAQGGRDLSRWDERRRPDRGLLLC